MIPVNFANAWHVCDNPDAQNLLTDMEKLGYQRLSKLLFRIDHLEISHDFDTRKNFIEFYI